MSQTNEPADHLGSIDVEPRRLPSMLNVLTILTFIGSGYGAISSIIAFFRAQSNYDQAVEVQSKMAEAQDLVKKLMGGDPVEMARKALENKVPILLLSLVGYALCTYGAIVMRELQKKGYFIYAVGEILPLFVILLFVGTGFLLALTGIMTAIIIIVFLILYATQLKYMKK
jgi:hypothetical protein